MHFEPGKETECLSLTRADKAGHIVRRPRTFDSADVDDVEQTIRARRALAQPARRQRGDLALDRMSSGMAVEVIDQLVQLVAELQLAPKRPRLAIKVDRRILFIDVNDVSAVEAEGNYVLLRAPNASHLVRESISTIEKQLAPFGFVRIHRSALINSAFVDEIQSCPTGEYILRLKGGKEFRVTRTYKKQLKSLAPLWIGADRLLDASYLKDEEANNIQANERDDCSSTGAEL